MKGRKVTQFDLTLTVKSGVIDTAELASEGMSDIFSRSRCAQHVSESQAAELKKCPDQAWTATHDAGVPTSLSRAMGIAFGSMLNDIIGYGEQGRNHPDVPK